jgi:hypothetical protein
MTVHLCPPEGSGMTPCCDKTPFELPYFDRITEDAEQVTCEVLKPDEPVLMNAQQLADYLKVSYRQIDYWIRTEYLLVPNCGGSGYKRAIPEVEVRVATLLVRLLHAGLTLSAAGITARRMIAEDSTSMTLPADVLIVCLPERIEDAPR